MTDKTPLKPPDGYKTWIDYAIATMDVRTLHLESCDTDTVILSDDFRQAARDERDELVAALAAFVQSIDIDGEIWLDDIAFARIVLDKAGWKS